MAKKTQLSLMATPGRRHLAWVAKAVAVVVSAVRKLLLLGVGS